MRIRSVFTHSAQAILEGALISMLVVGLMAGTAFAGRGGGGKPSGGTASGSCSVNPDPVAIGADWTASASNLGANRILNVLVTDSVGTTAFNLGSDEGGRLSFTWHSYWSGQSTIKVNALEGRKTVLVATCVFAVR